MIIGKTYYALVDPKGKGIVWDYDDPILDSSKKNLLFRLKSIKENEGRDLLQDNVIRKIKVEFVK